MNFIWYSSPARISCAHQDVLLFRPWTPNLLIFPTKRTIANIFGVRFFFSLYSFLVLERFLNKLHLFYFSLVASCFCRKGLFEFKKLSHLFFLTVNLGYYCLQIDFKTLQLTRCSAVISNVAPPHVSCFDYVTFRPYFLSINQPDRHLIYMHIPFLFFSWTLCV